VRCQQQTRKTGIVVLRMHGSADAACVRAPGSRAAGRRGGLRTRTHKATAQRLLSTALTHTSACACVCGCRARTAPLVVLDAARRRHPLAVARVQRALRATSAAA
jgi:hypothetical protein